MSFSRNGIVAAEVPNLTFSVPTAAAWTKDYMLQHLREQGARRPGDIERAWAIDHIGRECALPLLVWTHETEGLSFPVNINALYVKRAVHISNLSRHILEADLRDIMAHFGRLTQVVVGQEEGWITYHRREAANDAVEAMQGYQSGGRLL